MTDIEFQNDGWLSADRSFSIRRTGRLTLQYREAERYVEIDVEIGFPSLAIYTDSIQFWTTRSGREIVSATDRQRIIINMQITFDRAQYKYFFHPPLATDLTGQIQPQFGDVVLGNRHPNNHPQPTDVVLGNRPISIDKERQIYALLTDTVQQLKREIFGTAPIPPNADNRILTIERADIDRYVRQNGLPAAALDATRNRTQGIWLIAEDDRFCVGYWERGIITDRQCFDTYAQAEAAFIDLSIEIAGINLPRLQSPPEL